MSSSVLLLQTWKNIRFIILVLFVPFYRPRKMSESLHDLIHNPYPPPTYTTSIHRHELLSCYSHVRLHRSITVHITTIINIVELSIVMDLFLSANKNATGQLEAQHWKDMLSKPKQSVEYWHRLKPE